MAKRKPFKRIISKAEIEKLVQGMGSNSGSGSSVYIYTNGAVDAGGSDTVLITRDKITKTGEYTFLQMRPRDSFFLVEDELTVSDDKKSITHSKSYGTWTYTHIFNPETFTFEEL